MFNLIHEVSLLISKRLVTIAEIAMWSFVAVGVCRVAINGINGISSLLLGGSIAVMGLAVLFYFVAFFVKLVVNKPKTKEWKYDSNRRGED